MPIRVFCLLHTVICSDSATLATSLSFATTLQLAAGRAWTHHVAARAPLQGAGTRRIHATKVRRSAAIRADGGTSIQAGPSTIPNADSLLEKPLKKSRKAETPAKLKVQPEPVSRIEPPLYLSKYLKPMVTDQDPCNTETLAPEFLGPPRLFPRTMHRMKRTPKALRPKPPPDLPVPTDPKALHTNLVYMITSIKPPPRLPALIDYHNQYPELHSTASYNLLVHLSIRHTSYGITRRLLDDHVARNIPRDLESYKLEVRSFVQRGQWERAWRFIDTLKQEGHLPGTLHDDEAIPLPIWLEFCRPNRLQHWRRKEVYDSTGKILRRILEKVTEPTDQAKARQTLLNKHRPKNMPPLSHTSPFAIYCIVQLLLRSGSTKPALELTKAFFSALPRSLRADRVERCLDIIHAHMQACVAKDGLPRFYEARRVMVSLVKLHRGLKPNTKTLYLLLRPLHRAKKCGTIAWKTLLSAKAQWGPLVEDRRVQRRVLHLAMKEGRTDIVHKVLAAESKLRFSRKVRLHKKQTEYQITPEDVQSASALPLHIIYANKGKDARLWYRVRSKIHQYYLKPSRRKFISSYMAKRTRQQGLPPLSPT